MPRPVLSTEPTIESWRIRDLPITDVPLPAGFVIDDDEPFPLAPADPSGMALARDESDTSSSPVSPPSAMLGMLAGVTVDDGGVDDLLEQRTARDRPRLALEPRHATIIILILVLALSLSLTLLVQQGMRLSTMSWNAADGTAGASSTSPSDTPDVPSPDESATPSDTPPESPDTNATGDPSAAPSASPTSTLIDLNTASSEQLQTIKGIGPVTAQRIIDHRTEIGRYTSVDQLLDVPGIGAKTLEKIRPYVEVRS
ncbi:helix-hairpin-helix domain-containing protein [Bifidobacterium callimiconis]|uniref:ComEA family DNA-binding protein n=1 Tax=Bifidobacterium callimiconis TaxID=2306973 RepID=UPI001BDD1053|nr:helix-hairpin-helix domain-containing protein [Bifidobacterium callimiconis]